MKTFISSRILPEWLEKIRERSEVDQSLKFDQGNLPAAELIARMQGCQIAVIENDEITAEVLAHCPNLAAIVDFRGTVDNIDIEAATRNGTIILNTPGRNADAVADLTIGLMIDLVRNVLPGAQAVRENRWVTEGTRWAYITYQGRDLPGKTVGLVGLGNIGRLVAQRLTGFRVKLLGYDPYVSPQAAQALGITLCGLDELLETADFVSLHLPLNAQTDGLLDEQALRRMKSSAYLINTSRAAVVDEQALIRCLTEGWIAGAALDVFHEEPVGKDYPLVHLPHVICTPHLGGATRDVVANHCRIGVESLLAFLDGQTPPNILNPAAVPAARSKLAEQG